MGLGLDSIPQEYVDVHKKYANQENKKGSQFAETPSCNKLFFNTTYVKNQNEKLIPPISHLPGVCVPKRSAQALSKILSTWTNIFNR